MGTIKINTFKVKVVVITKNKAGREPILKPTYTINP